jgi:hypothetical protein
MRAPLPSWQQRQAQHSQQPDVGLQALRALQGQQPDVGLRALQGLLPGAALRALQAQQPDVGRQALQVAGRQVQRDAAPGPGPGPGPASLNLAAYSLQTFRLHLNLRSLFPVTVIDARAYTRTAYTISPSKRKLETAI